MSIEIESRQLPFVGDFMGDAGVPIEEQEIAISEEKPKKPERQNGDARKNRHYHMSVYEREEARKSLGRVFEEMSDGKLTDESFRSFRAKGEADSANGYSNGHAKPDTHIAAEQKKPH